VGVGKLGGRIGENGNKRERGLDVKFNTYRGGGLTNKQLKMYLKQKGLKIKQARSKAELIDRVLTHARGNLSARDAVGDEESPKPCEGDTSSESSDSDDSSNDSSTYVEESFEVMFVPEEELQQVNWI